MGCKIVDVGFPTCLSINKLMKLFNFTGGHDHKSVPSAVKVKKTSEPKSSKMIHEINIFGSAPSSRSMPVKGVRRKSTGGEASDHGTKAEKPKIAQIRMDSQGRKSIAKMTFTNVVPTSSSSGTIIKDTAQDTGQGSHSSRIMLKDQGKTGIHGVPEAK
jgi:hypothetical protein